MMPEVFYTASALRVIKKFSPLEKEMFLGIVEEIKSDPQAGGFLKGSLPYRVVYKLEDKAITIVATGKRKDFYELL